MVEHRVILDMDDCASMAKAHLEGRPFIFAEGTEPPNADVIVVEGAVHVVWYTEE